MGVAITSPGPRRKASSALPKHPTTPLASSQIDHDQLTIELVEPDGMPAMVRIVWPNAPTIVDPRRFPDTAGTIAQLFARAHIVLAALKAHGQ
jgi:uncharacterized ferritin-like protein (DUF455 family)